MKIRDVALQAILPRRRFKACRVFLPNDFYKLFACSPYVPRGILRQ